MTTSAHARLWRLLAGGDGAARPGLPWAEALAPLTLAALVVLVVNDRVLKPAIGGELGWLTGKLSDVAGVIAAPLVATALVDVGGWALARLGAPVVTRSARGRPGRRPGDRAAGARAAALGGIDWTLRRWKLAAAIAVCAAGVCAVKLSADGAAAMEHALGAIGFDARVVADPTDLLALPALALAWWQGTRAIARGAHGRLAWAAARHRRGRPVAGVFADAAACGADPARVVELEAATAAWLAGGPAADVDRALARLRGLPGTP